MSLGIYALVILWENIRWSNIFVKCISIKITQNDIGDKAFQPVTESA